MGLVIYIFKSHRSERIDQHKCHAQERKDWKESTDKQFSAINKHAQKVEVALSKLEGAIITKRSGL